METSEHIHLGFIGAGIFMIVMLVIMFALITGWMILTKWLEKKGIL